MLINKKIQEIIQTVVTARPNVFLWGISGLIFLVGFGLLLTISVNSYGSTFIGILLMFGSVALIGAATQYTWTGFKIFQDVCLIFLYISSPFVPTQT